MNVLLVVAHPDDEILGAGATIHKLAEFGTDISVLTLGMSSATRENDLVERQKRSHEIIGVKRQFCGNLDAMKFRYCDRHSATMLIESVIRETEPDWVITHHPDDLHDDHKVTAGLTQEAVRLPQRKTGYTKTIAKFMYMEVATATDWSMAQTFHPNTFIRVADTDISAKINALEVYENVIRDIPHPRNTATIKALSRIRGAQSGLDIAEAFQTAMEVINHV